ncbi:ABC transporter ATP-binding protein [Tabrizicola sp.]|uniref:ABC transporter ATP-binding protein n=1 Tax=Tabrizicola sp. TaxID=2005166 RepID=UPI00260C1707|nr:ABC transporter ATP-binding protein [Tabrizicola sp.]MDM7931515.1 ABC transporter ATP-binding protein [Tabrizicola sp.]
MLEVRNMDVGYYRDLNILSALNLDVKPGQIVTILGANGVGKSTSLKAIYGFLRPNGGTIHLNGQPLINVPTHERINLGLAYIPQHPGVFREMTVEENLLLGAWTFRRDKARIARKLEEQYSRFPVLKEKRRQPSGQLSGGQQRMIEIGRTLMGNPRVLLVDEPTAGLSKTYAEEVYQMLRDLRDRDNLGILLVDQEIRHALRIADYVYVLELGRNKFEGPPSEFGDLQKAFWVA